MEHYYYTEAPLYQPYQNLAGLKRQELKIALRHSVQFVGIFFQSTSVKIKFNTLQVQLTPSSDTQHPPRHWHHPENHEGQGFSQYQSLSQQLRKKSCNIGVHPVIDS
jgi:hypothetical protein